MKTAIVTTTIRVPRNLEAYADDIKANGPEGTDIIVAGDTNTDLACDEWCLEKGFYYLSPDTQNFWLQERGFSEYKDFLPWNCVQRRNVGILFAYHNGAEIIVTLDDDNLWKGNGYFAQHGKLGQEETFETVKAVNTGWANPARNLVSSTSIFGFYPRGYSFKHRGVGDAWEFKNKTGRRVVNAGLWTGDPDIDAVTRLSSSPEIAHWIEYDMILDTGTKCPFNSQNTALHRDIIPAYCLATGVGRYDDILASYVVTRIAHHLGDYISFGRPIVHQVRNDHDIYKDLADELLGMRLIDRIVDWFYDIKLTKTNYKDCTAELMLGFEDRINTYFSNEDVSPERILFLRSIVTNYKHWMAVT